MVEHLKKEALNRYGSELQVNWEKTQEIQQEDKYVKFNRWCDENGILHPTTQYPVAFGDSGELIGIAATREIGLGEAYIFVPCKCILNEFKFRADPQIGHLLQKHEDFFEEADDAQHLKLIFFVLHEMSKGEQGFWYPYFEISALPDVPMNWSEKELDELHDPIMKQEAIDEKEEVAEQFEEVLEIVQQNADCLNVEFWTLENWMKAHFQVGTRCFGYAVPEISLVPYADNANHHTTDNQYELLNLPIAQKMRQDPDSLTSQEQYYSTTDRKQIDFFTHLPASHGGLDGNLGSTEKVMPVKGARYARKVERRHAVSTIYPFQLLNNEDLMDRDIWELGYASTSDEDDNDEDEESSSEEESENGSDQEENKTAASTTVSGPTDIESVLSAATQVAAPVEETKEESQVASPPQQDPEGKPTDKPNNGVPAFAKKLVQSNLMRGKKREPLIRYVYTHVPENGDAPQKTAVIKKRLSKSQPNDLVQMLIEKKQILYQKEQKMQTERESEDIKYRESTTEYLSSDEEDLEENFVWYKDTSPGNYFCLCTKTKNVIEENQQVYVCYGRRSNRYLLSCYGFTLAKNKYNALSFRVWLDFRSKDSQGNKAAVEEDIDENRISKVIKLKENRIKDDLLAYIRMSLIQKSENQTGEKVKDNILISTPVDIEFEMLTLGCTIHLLQQLLDSRFQGVTVEQDRAELAKQDLPWRARQAITHRLNCKEILASNIKLCNVLIRILANLQVELAKGNTEFTKLECKKIYLERVQPYETTPEEVMANRLTFRNYFRELILNQQRVMDKIAREKGGQQQPSTIQDLVDKAKQDQQPTSQKPAAPSDGVTIQAEHGTCNEEDDK